MGLVIFFLLLLEGYAIFVGRLGFIIFENKLIFSKLFLRLKDFFWNSYQHKNRLWYFHLIEYCIAIVNKWATAIQNVNDIYKTKTMLD